MRQGFQLGRGVGGRVRVPGQLRDRLDRYIDARIARTLNGRPASQLSELFASEAAKEAIASEVSSRLAAQAGRDFTLGLLLGDEVRSKRTMSPAGYRRLVREISSLTGAKSVGVDVSYALRALLDSESRGVGRIAGTVYNIVGKLATPPLLDLPEGPILEIGTLHGLFAPTLVRSFRRVGDVRHITIIDPFTGRQMQGGTNLATDISGSPVTSEIAEYNFHELGLAEDDFRLVRGFSTDEAVRSIVGDRRYSLVIVDGDHFEAGVLQDLQWVEKIVQPGGVAVLDDYGDRKWPGVEAATKRYLADGGLMGMLGTVWTSAFLQMPRG